MAAAKVNLTIEKGAQYLKTFIWQTTAKIPISLSGLSGRMQLRSTVEASSFVIELTTVNGGIVLEAGGSIGQIDIIIGAQATDAISIDFGVYDIELYDALDLDNVNRVVEGVVSIIEGVTR